MTQLLLPYADWERGLLAIGYHVAATSTQGSVLFACEGKASRRVSPWEPNEATACWMRRTGVVDCRCELDEDAACDRRTDLPEFGLETGGDPYHGDLSHVSKSMLSVFADSPVKYRATYILGTMPRKKPTKPMKLGTILHRMLLEKATLEETCIAYPYSCYTDGETPRLSTKRAEAFEAKVAPLICIREAEMPTIRTMVAAALASPFGELLQTHSDKAKFETRVDGLIEGVKVKCRPDCHVVLRDQIVVPDLKFTALFGPDDFLRSARRFGYFLQESHYRAILEQHYGLPVSWSFWLGETVPPHRFGVREYDETSIEISNTYHRGLLRRLKQCQDSGEWKDTFDTTLTIAPWDVPSEGDEADTIHVGG